MVADWTASLSSESGLAVSDVTAVSTLVIHVLSSLQTLPAHCSPALVSSSPPHPPSAGGRERDDDGEQTEMTGGHQGFCARRAYRASEARLTHPRASSTLVDAPTLFPRRAAVYIREVRLGIFLLAGCVAALAAANSTVRATPSACTASALSPIEYNGRTYRPVPLTLPRQALLATVRVWVQDQPCNDTGFTPSPLPPLPPPRAVKIPLERLVGIAPQVAVGAADNDSLIWVRSSCRHRAAMDVAAGCLQLDDAAAYAAARGSGAMPSVTTPRGSFPMVVRSRTTCPSATLAEPAPICRTEAGVVKRAPRVPVRLGDRLLFAPDDTLSSISISYGRQAPVEYTQESWRGWKVNASGRYTLRIVVRGENPAYRHVTTYMLPLRVAR